VTVSGLELRLEVRTLILLRDLELEMVVELEMAGIPG
jgi:hypothetical protein